MENQAGNNTYKGSLIFREESVSTNTELKELAAAGAPWGTALAVLRQTGGRGRLGRSFISDEGGLYMSVLLRFPEPDIRLSAITAVTGVLVSELLDRELNIATRIKWPNDILLNGKKLCGILTESVIGPESMAMVVGMGINLNQREFPEDIRDRACSLYTETGRTADIRKLAECLLSELLPVYEKAPEYPERCLSAYKSSCVTLGEVLPNGGIAKGIAEDYSLIIQMPDGSEQRKFFGEVPYR